MPYSPTTNLSIDVAVCSTDNEDYTIFVRHNNLNNGPDERTVTRDGNTLPTANFPDVAFGNTIGIGTLNVSGVIGAGNNTVTLTLSSTDIDFDGMGYYSYYYGTGSLTAEVTVPLTLGGSCPSSPFED